VKFGCTYLSKPVEGGDRGWCSMGESLAGCEVVCLWQRCRTCFAGAIAGTSRLDGGMVALRLSGLPFVEEGVLAIYRVENASRVE
jgi:hypothetical protein